LRGVLDDAALPHECLVRKAAQGLAQVQRLGHRRLAGDQRGIDGHHRRARRDVELRGHDSTPQIPERVLSRRFGQKKRCSSP